MKTLKYIMLIVIASLSTGTYAHIDYSLLKAAEIKKDTSLIVTNKLLNTASIFSFSHKYVMQIKKGNRTTDMLYYLAPSGNYFATGLNTNNQNKSTISVMDLSNKTIHTLMDNNGDKTRISMRLNLDKASNYMIDQTNVEVTPTGTTKTILGYVCDGYKVEGDNMKGTVWVTQNAGISFSKHLYKTDSTNSQNATFLKLTTGLTLEMDMIDTSRRRPKSILMKCISLEKKNITINTNDYKKLI